MFVRANFVGIYSQGKRDRSMRSGTELAREIKLTDWSMARNLPNRSSPVQIPRDICTRLKRYLYSAKCSWIIKPIIMKRVWAGMPQSSGKKSSEHRFQGNWGCSYVKFLNLICSWHFGPFNMFKSFYCDTHSRCVFGESGLIWRDLYAFCCMLWLFTEVLNNI